MLVPLVLSFLCPCASLANSFEHPLIQFFRLILSLFVCIQEFSGIGIKYSIYFEKRIDRCIGSMVGLLLD